MYFYTSLGLQSSTDDAAIEIIGTTAIPEFPVAIIIASVAIGVMITIIRVGKFVRTSPS